MILTLRQIVLQCRWSLKNRAPFFDHVFVLYMWEKSYRLVYCEFVRVKNANTYGVWNITVLGPNFHDFHSKSKKYITTFRNNRTTNENFYLLCFMIDWRLIINLGPCFTYWMRKMYLILITTHSCQKQYLTSKILANYTLSNTSNLCYGVNQTKDYPLKRL